MPLRGRGGYVDRIPKQYVILSLGLPPLPATPTAVPAIVPDEVLVGVWEVRGERRQPAQGRERLEIPFQDRVHLNKTAARRLIGILVASIETGKLQERPNITRGLLEDIRGSSVVEGLVVSRRNGVEAFTDLATLREVSEEPPGGQDRPPLTSRISCLGSGTPMPAVPKRSTSAL